MTECAQWAVLEPSWTIESYFRLRQHGTFLFFLCAFFALRCEKRARIKYCLLFLGVFGHPSGQKRPGIKELKYRCESARRASDRVTRGNDATTAVQLD